MEKSRVRVWELISRKWEQKALELTMDGDGDSLGEMAGHSLMIFLFFFFSFSPFSSYSSLYLSSSLFLLCRERGRGMEMSEWVREWVVMASFSCHMSLLRANMWVSRVREITHPNMDLLNEWIDGRSADSTGSSVKTLILRNWFRERGFGIEAIHDALGVANWL